MPRITQDQSLSFTVHISLTTRNFLSHMEGKDAHIYRGMSLPVRILFTAASVWSFIASLFTGGKKAFTLNVTVELESLVCEMTSFFPAATFTLYTRLW